MAAQAERAPVILVMDAGNATGGAIARPGSMRLSLRSTKPWAMRETRGQDGLVNSEAIAETSQRIHCQPKSARTFELDIKPGAQPW